MLPVWFLHSLRLVFLLALLLTAALLVLFNFMRDRYK
jgi:hypothetical protein